MVSELSVKNCIESNSIFNSKKEKKAHKKPKPRKKVCKFKGIACKDGENLSECLCHRGCSAIDSHLAFYFYENITFYVIFFMNTTLTCHMDPFMRTTFSHFTACSVSVAAVVTTLML